LGLWQFRNGLREYKRAFADFFSFSLKLLLSLPLFYSHLSLTDFWKTQEQEDEYSSSPASLITPARWPATIGWRRRRRSKKICSVFNKQYIKSKLSSSSIQIFTQNCQKLSIKAWIYVLLIENFEHKT
jgi:hypothetical protein